MNTKTTTQDVGVDTAFLAPYQNLAARIERVKSSIVAEFRDAFKTRRHLLENVLHEADALAWQTEYPHLVFPALALEKVQAAIDWIAQSQSVRQRSAAFAVAI
jgi:hypothetical protein